MRAYIQYDERDRLILGRTVLTNGFVNKPGWVEIPFKYTTSKLNVRFPATTQRAYVRYVGNRLVPNSVIVAKYRPKGTWMEVPYKYCCAETTNTKYNLYIQNTNPLNTGTITLIGNKQPMTRAIVDGFTHYTFFEVLEEVGAVITYTNNTTEPYHIRFSIEGMDIIDTVVQPNTKFNDVLTIIGGSGTKLQFTAHD